MTGTVEVALSEAYKLSLTPEWRSVCNRHHCMLVEGPESVTETVLALLKPHLLTPVVWTGSQSPLEFPAGSCGALVLRDVTALGRREQLRLLAWLNAPRDRTQVVSTTPHPLFPWVVRGHFDEALYYRLNVIRLRVDSKAITPFQGVGHRVLDGSSSGTLTYGKCDARCSASHCSLIQPSVRAFALGARIRRMITTAINMMTVPTISSI